MTRSEFEHFLRDFYRARLSNDVEQCLAFFTAGSTFRLAGSAITSMVGRSSESLEAIRNQVTELVRVWDWQAQEIRNVVIDGDTAAVRYSLTTVFKPSGEKVTTEIADVIIARDRKVVEFHQFVDTAAIAQIVAGRDVPRS